MTVLLWWSLASIAVSLVVGALLAPLGRDEPETIDLDSISPQPAASRAAGASSRPATGPVDPA